MSGTVKSMQAIRFKTDEIHDSATKLDLVKIVICSNCQEIPYRPIYTCQNGHIVCASCRGFNFRCGNCAAVVTDTRNRVAEEVVMSFVFRCKNFEEGCTKLIPSAEVFKHLQNECEFRPVACSERLREQCKGKLIHYSSFLQHLKEAHGIRRNRPSDSESFVKRIFHCDTVTPNTSWPLFCFEYDGETFFHHITIVNNIAYIWVSRFDSKDYPDYFATVILKKANSEVRHSFPVHSFRAAFVDVKRSGNYLTLLNEQLMNLAAENVRDEHQKIVYNYTWVCCIYMSKNGKHSSL